VKRPPVDVIELIEPDPWDGRAGDTNDTPGDGDGAPPATGRPRWVVPAGVAVLVGVVTVGIVSNASDSPPNRATTITATPTIAAPTTSPDDNDTSAAPRYIVRLPYGYFPVRANVISPPTLDDDLSATGVLSQLWASEGASQTSGRWISVNGFPGAGPRVWSPASYRTLLTLADGTVLSVAVSPTSTENPTMLVSYRLGANLVEIESFGYTLDELLDPIQAIAETTSADVPRGLDIDPTPFLDLQLLYSDKVDWRNQLFGATRSEFAASAPPAYGDGNGRIVVSVSEPAYRDPLLPFLIGSPTAFTVGRRAVGVAGTALRWWDGGSVAQWIDPDGWLVTIRSTLPVVELVEVAQSASPASDTEWRDRRRAAQSFTTLPTGWTALGKVADGSLSHDGGYWRLSLGRQQSDYFGERYGWRLNADGPDGATKNNAIDAGAIGRPALTSTVFNELTVITATLPGDYPSGAWLQIDRFGLDPIVVPLTKPEPDFTITAAAAVLEDVTPFVARIVRADGTVWATWPAL
jgi:hypothetical protein